MKKTKIVCTIGPKTESEKMLKQLLDSGMDVMRLNFSHGNYQEHKQRIKNLRNVLHKTNHQAAILLDTKGPEIRTMQLKNGSDILLKSGQIFTFTTDTSIIGDVNSIAVTYINFNRDVKVGNIILVDDGLIEMKVVNIKNNNVICKVLNNGILGENKGINIPGVSIKLPTLAEKDKLDLIFACQQNVDFIAPSFIRNKSDVIEIRKYLKRHGGEKIQIISKIENQEGLNNFNEILSVSDGIMVARGDLGVEIPLEKVIFAQKMMIKKCNEASKIVITATQMLDSMINNPRPTRAEAGDVANAILDGTDAVMLSGESAKGKYPIKSINMMKKISTYTDHVIKNNVVTKKEIYSKKMSVIDAICESMVNISKHLNISLIAVFTKSGKLARVIRKYCPNAFILAITNNFKTAQQLVLTKGIVTHTVDHVTSVDEFYRISKQQSLEKKFAKKGDMIIILSDVLIEKNFSKTISLHTL